MSLTSTIRDFPNVGEAKNSEDTSTIHTPKMGIFYEDTSTIRGQGLPGMLMQEPCIDTRIAYSE